MKQGWNRQSGAGNGNVAQFCVCAKCGFSLSHRKGVPCRMAMCPYCHIPLVRGGIDSSMSIEPKKESAVGKIAPLAGLQVKQILPEVNSDECVGCGTCIDVCRAGAISVVKDKAVINPELCIGCRACEKVCPMDAIH